MNEPNTTKHGSIYVYSEPYIVDYDKWRNEHIGCDFVCDESRTKDGICCVLGYTETSNMLDIVEYFKQYENTQLYGGLSHKEEGGCSVFCG